MKSKKKEQHNKKQHKRGGWLKVILGVIFFGMEMRKREGQHPVKRNFVEKEKDPTKPASHSAEASARKEKEKKKEAEEKSKGWLKAQPEQMPSPTYWPFFLALGLAFLFWGIISSWVILAVGLLIFIIALAGWINILRHEK